MTGPSAPTAGTRPGWGAIGCDLLVLAAHPLELSGLRARLGEGLAGVCHGLRLACATVGVGLLAAGDGTTRAVAKHQPRAAVLLGSYGYYPQSGGSLLELLLPARTRLLCPAVSAGLAAVPAPMVMAATFAPALLRGLQRTCPAAGSADLATTLAITTDAGLAQRLGAEGCHGENLEALAVALACAAQGVRVAGLFGATNQVGPAGRAQWAAHRDLVAERTAAALFSFLAEGAPGL